MGVVPAALTLFRVMEARPLVDPSTNPTPLGYSWSLLLFLVPTAGLGAWFLRARTLTFQRRSFWTTLAILAPLGIVLDLWFGNSFFVFPNTEATLGIGVPARGGPIPVEEIVFYVSGFLVVLLFYLWADEYWMAAYNISDYPTESAKVERLVRFDGRALGVGAALLVLAIVYKRYFSAVPEGFPAYFAYLLAAAILPAAGFYRSVERFINWRAFSMTFFFLLLVSLLWEATLGVPYGWWGYRPRMMIGIFVNGWSDLPLEAVVVWLAVTYASVILFEVVKVYQASGRSFRDALLGTVR